MSTTPTGIIGRPTPRIDGPLKTSGAAKYANDFHIDNMAYAVPVVSSIASGRIRSLDTSAAERMPGVLLVLHHGNIGPLYRTVPGDNDATNSEVRSAFEDDVVRHWGQYIALVVAETFEQATAAAARIRGNARTTSAGARGVRGASPSAAMWRTPGPGCWRAGKTQPLRSRRPGTGGRKAAG